MSREYIAGFHKIIKPLLSKMKTEHTLLNLNRWRRNTKIVLEYHNDHTFEQYNLSINNLSN